MNKESTESLNILLQGVGDMLKASLPPLVNFLHGIVTQAADIIIQTFHNISDWLPDWLKEMDYDDVLRIKAINLDLVSPRIVALSYSSRAKIKNKNLNRIKRELRLYEKRNKDKKV